jgi:chromosomal replication initiation ATPase DnaA
VKTELTEIEKESIDKLVSVYRQELVDHVMNAPIVNRQGVNIENITNTVLRYYGVTRDSLYSRDRKAHIVKCRAVVFWLLRQPEMETGLSLTRIAEIAFMNHASVIHNIKRIDNELLFEDRYTVAELTEILRSLGFRFFKQGTKFVIR